jgi:hypothetical protein
MAVDQTIEQIQEALKVNDLKSELPSSLDVIDIRVEDYVDSDGQDALRVTVIIGEGVDVKHVSGQDVSDLKSIIGQRIRDLGVPFWAYIEIAKQSELDEDDEE